MEKRITGVLIAAFAIYTIYLSVNALLHSAEFAKDMAESAPIYGLSIDAADFLFHWRVANTTGGILAGLGLVAGIAMFVLKRWSCLLTVGIVACWVFLSLVSAVSGYSRYGFEHLGLIPLAVYIVVMIMAMVAYRTWNRGARDASNA